MGIKNQLRISKSVKNILSGFLLLLWSASLFAGEENFSNQKIIRLGYFNYQNYMLGAEEGAKKSGFAYDLLCDVAAINNWKYEFVFGDFPQLYEQLLKGEIDILPCTVFTPERAKAHLFSNEEIYSEEYYVSALDDIAKKTLSIKDLNGKKISTLENSYQNSVFTKWAEKNGISMELVYSASFDYTWELVKEGKADYILNIDSAAKDSDFSTLFDVGSGSSRFAIARGREDIRDGLTSAIYTINEINPFAISHLKEKYLTETLSSQKLSEEEEKWLEGRNVIRIAGFNGEQPYTYVDEDGFITGVYPDLLLKMFERLGIKKNIEWIGFDSLEEMHKALADRRVDLLCPDYYEHYYAQNNDIIISEKIMNVNMGLLHESRTREIDIKKIATPSTKLGVYFVEDNFEDAEILKCETAAQAIKAVASGKVDGAVAHIAILENKSAKYLRNFQITTLVSSCPVCFSALSENGALICIINRGLHLISESDLQYLEIEHAPVNNYALWAYVRKNLPLCILILFSLIIIIFFAIERNAVSIKLQKNVDELAVAKEAANAASKAKSTFLFNMSHDIRTPMNAILGYSDRMLKHIGDEKIITDSAKKIKSSGEYLLSLINDVLDMARIESDNVEIEEDVYDMRARAYKLCDVFEVNMLQKDLIFNVDFSDMQDTVVWYDSLKLRQVMLNLISNSVKYTPNGGTITHTIKQLPSETPGFGKYEIVVQDTGMGMSEEYVKHIFEQFSRSDDSITKETQGTGLGMSIVGKLVEMMGGTIDIKSKIGEGTKTTVILELKIASEEEIVRLKKEEEQIQTDILKGLKILLVEDNEFNREIAQEVLEGEGCIVVDIAQNGVIAFGKVQNSNPGDFDIILMDVQMPVMDGYEATKRIRALENKELANVPIIAMTANAFDEDRQDALAAGMNAHLTKPIEMKKLRETLAKFM